MSTAREQIEALTKGLTAADTGRRVGWARAYSAEASKDELSRQINMLRAERDIMRRAASYMLGFFNVWVSQSANPSAAHQAIRGNLEQIGAVLDEEIQRAGSRAAIQVLSKLPGSGDIQASMESLRTERQKLKKDKSKMHDAAWKAGRDQERKLLTKRYGFPNEAAMLNYLEQYAGPVESEPSTGR